MPGQLVLPVVLLTTESTRILPLILVDLLHVSHQELLGLEQCLTSETLVLDTLPHLNQMFFSVNLVLGISPVKLLVTNEANVDLLKTLGVRMIGQMLPHGLHSAKVHFPANLTGEG